jgi:hypothetical protein
MAQCSFGLPKHSFGEHEMKSEIRTIPGETVRELENRRKKKELDAGMSLLRLARIVASKTVALSRLE